MKNDDIPFYLRKINDMIEQRLSDVVSGKRSSETQPERPAKGQNDAAPRQPNRESAPRMRNDMDYMEPDWEDLDRKADMIVARYAVVSFAFNVLPPPLDVMGVTGVFTKMTTELAGVYQVNVSMKRSRQIGWAIASTTASVLGITYAGSRLMKFIPGGGWLASLLVQAPIVGAVSWAAGDALKGYFKQSRQGVEPSIASLRDAFANTLHIKMRGVKVKEEDIIATVTTTPTVANPTSVSVSSVVEQIASLHELLRAGAITQAEFDSAKVELLKKL